MLINQSMIIRTLKTKIISGFFNNPLPLRWGRVRVGVDKSDLVHDKSPLPIIPSRRGEEEF